MLKKIHVCHLGMEKCFSRAGPLKRKLPVVEFVIIMHRNYQVKEPLLPHTVPDRPWQVLALDMLVLAQGKFVVLVGYYSKYFELTQLKDSTSASNNNNKQ